MRKVQVYIGNQKLELFDDEQIQITSSVQNVQDIAKVFTDFSQSFTVPASPINNQIFQHFYQTDVDSTLDYQLRRDAKIEIDLVLFRTGKMQLEKANLKKGMAESYTITFFGDVRTLQDYFGDDKLAVLDFSPYTHEYNGPEVQARITNTTDYDVRYPLISNGRFWTYGDATSTDISVTGTQMSFTELSPALKIRRVFDAIETRYGIDFVGAFITDQRFDKAFLYLKNKQTFNFVTTTQRFDFVTTDDSTHFDIANDVVNIEYDPLDISGGFRNLEIKVIAVSNIAVTYYVDVFENGTLTTTLTNSNLGSIGSINYYNEVGLEKQIYFEVRAEDAIDITFEVVYSAIVVLADQITIYYINTNAVTSSMSLVGDLDISTNAPDIMVSDFVKGILKEFNLTIAPLSPTKFELLPLEDWYAKGRIIDITPYTDIDSIGFERVKLYKRIAFKYQPSESITNKTFLDTFGREYGDLEQTYDYDGTEYVVESPFENLMHSKFTGTDLQVGYLIDRNLGVYVPKPMLLYMAEQTECSFKFNNGTTTDTITDYMPFGQDTYANGQYLSLNFGPEISSLREIVINNHIFNTYYSNYINNLYVRKNRLVYVKCYLPLALLTSIRLNDRVIIRDKRYVINEMKTNLTTGEVNLVLLLDFRRLVRRRPKWTIPSAGLTLKSPVIMPNGAIEFNIDEGTTGIVATPNRGFDDANVQFVIPPNANGGYLLMTEDGDNLDTEDYNNLRSEEGTPEILNIEITYDFPDGSTETQDYPFVISDL
jgi:hypothetical protein